MIKFLTKLESEKDTKTFFFRLQFKIASQQTIQQYFDEVQTATVTLSATQSLKRERKISFS